MQGKSAGPGKVGWIEFAAEWAKIGWNQQIAAQMWADCDKNKSGSVTRDEFLAFVAAPALAPYVKKHEDTIPRPVAPVVPACVPASAPAPAPPAQYSPPPAASPYGAPTSQAPPAQFAVGARLFQHIDGKGGVKDNLLEWGEFMPMIKQVGWDEQTAARMWHDADKNRDGRLTMEEFLAFCQTPGVQEHIARLEQNVVANAPPPFSYSFLRCLPFKPNTKAEHSVELAKQSSMPIAAPGYLVLELTAAPIYKHYLAKLERAPSAKSLAVRPECVEHLKEGQTGLKTFQPGRHALVRAWYGDASAKFSSKGKDVTQLVRTKLAQAGPGAVTCSNGALGGDPFPGLPKELVVEFGLSPTASPAGSIPGSECAGKVVRVGAGVTGFREGQTVHCTGRSDGSWSEYILARADTCTVADPHIPADDLAQMLEKPSVAYALAFEKLRLARGQWVLVTAPGSTVAQCFIQMCKAKGVKTICLIRAPERSLRADHFRKLGADLVLSIAVRGPRADLAASIARAVGPGGVRYAVDACGGDTLTKFVLPSMAVGGTVVVYKLLEKSANLSIPAELLLEKQLSVTGFRGDVFFSQADAATAKRVKAGVMQMFAAKQVRMPETVKIPLSMYKEAVSQSRANGDHKSRILLVRG